MLYLNAAVNGVSQSLNIKINENFKILQKDFNGLP